MTGRRRHDRLGVSTDQWAQWPDPQRRSRVRAVLLGGGVLIAVVAALLLASAVGGAAAGGGVEESAPAAGSKTLHC